MLIEHMQMTQSYQFQINQKKHWKETQTPTSLKLNVTDKKTKTLTVQLAFNTKTKTMLSVLTNLQLKQATKHHFMWLQAFMWHTTWPIGVPSSVSRTVKQSVVPRTVRTIHRR